jgi:ABC-type multidrug transport system ATPase subunit
VTRSRLIPPVVDDAQSDDSLRQGCRVTASLTSAALTVDDEPIEPCAVAGTVVPMGEAEVPMNGRSSGRGAETPADLPGEAAKHRRCLNIQAVSLTIEQRLCLLKNVSFSARPGTVTAIIGPSGAGKSTLAKLVAGAAQPTVGAVTLDGHDIHTHFGSLRTRIGMVPQDDLVHRHLTVEQALGYAAEWRLPPDATKEDRRRAVARVLDELELTEHARTRVDKLSGGQRKRASVAMELLTGASLLILDEPTSGLDPALDRQVMSTLRRLADAGRVVLVVTHSLTYLHMCDQVLLMAPGGKVAFCGPPEGIGQAMGTTDWADIFTKVSSEPDTVNGELMVRESAAAAAAHAPPASPPARSRQTGLLRQLSTVARRQVRLILTDRGYLVFLALLPFVLGALTLIVPGSAGLGVADPRGDAPSEPAQILMLLNTSAVFMGVALTIRDLVGERAIFRREQSVGLSARIWAPRSWCSAWSRPPRPRSSPASRCWEKAGPPVALSSPKAPSWSST